MYFPKLLFDAGTWPLVNKTEQRTIHSYVMKIYRSFFAQDFSDVDRLVSDIDYN